MHTSTIYVFLPERSTEHNSTYLLQIINFVSFRKLYRYLAKGYQTRFRAYSMRNPRIACNADNVCKISPGEFNLNFKKWRQV
jgi:hypothetical protein